MTFSSATSQTNSPFSQLLFDLLELVPLHTQQSLLDRPGILLKFDTKRLGIKGAF
jgi:hypothetical protein